MQDENDENDDENDASVIPENLGPRLMGWPDATARAHARKASGGTETDSDWPSLAHVSPSVRISSDPSLVTHGRGLVATRDISAGSLLFVHPPTVRADVSQVLRIYQNKARSGNGNGNGNGSDNLLESIAETVLLKEMKRAIRGRSRQNASARIVASFLALNGDHHSDGPNEKNDGCQDLDAHGDADADADADCNGDADAEREEEQHRHLVRVLLGKGTVRDTERILDRFATAGGKEALLESNDFLLGIIRHNAFGPDFHNYPRMERELRANNHNKSSGNGKHQTSSNALYSRVLGHYPLAAMINHSCGPTNATRVFYGEVMVATATSDISAGTELVWPYCPPILPLHERSDRLSNGYGFSCGCLRCRSEASATDDEGGIPPPEIAPCWNGDDTANDEDRACADLDSWSRTLRALGVWYKVVAAKAKLRNSNSNNSNSNNSNNSNSNSNSNIDNNSGEQKRNDLLQESLRLGHTRLYIRYFNEALQQNESRARILEEATELHFAFCKIHNACTEHLSLLHLCYELSVLNGNNRNQEAIRSWTERLKQAHLCRYSSEIVGRDLETLRTVLKHTRAVLRSRDGWKANEFCGVQGRNSFL